MADRSNQLLLHALTRAASDAGGLPLFSSKTAEGLFPNTAPGKQAAQRCRDEGLLLPLDEGSGKSGPLCSISEKGLGYLFDQFTPRQVLEDFVRILETRENQVAQLAETAREMRASLEGLRVAVVSALSRLDRPSGDLKLLLSRFRAEPSVSPPDKTWGRPEAARVTMEVLQQRSGPGDCPLPELYRQVCQTYPDWTIGEFHDGLRQLHDEGQLYLHPWTGPLYAMPEPPYALLIGHEVAYYASPRQHTALVPIQAPAKLAV